MFSSKLFAMLAMVALLATLCLVTGCATSDPRAGSDLPWNTPQPWEGVPSVPGTQGF